MRKLRVFESISIDGYFCDGSGDFRFSHMDRDAEFDGWVAGNASGGGALLFGRTTYEMMSAFWPSAIAAEQFPVVAKGMNASPKYVVAHTLEPTWNNTKALRSIDDVRALKASDGPGIALLGSGNLAAQLGAAGLVDEYQFVIVPVALGGGRTVFSAKQKLKLVEQRAFKNGNVMVSYATA